MSGEEELAPEVESHEAAESYASIVMHSSSTKDKPVPKKGTKTKSTQGSKTSLLVTAPPRQSQMTSLGKVSSGLGGAMPKDGSGIHEGLVEVESLGEILSTTMAKSKVSRALTSDDETLSALFASTHPSWETLLVDQSLVTENARLKEQVSCLTKTVDWQLKARVVDPLSSDLTEGVKKVFTENTQLRAQLRTAETQNAMLGGVVAKNT